MLLEKTLEVSVSKFESVENRLDARKWEKIDE